MITISTVRFALLAAGVVNVMPSGAAALALRAPDAHAVVEKKCLLCLEEGDDAFGAVVAHPKEMQGAPLRDWVSLSSFIRDLI